jgi:hypothetical protein
MSKKTFVAELREQNKIMRDALSREEPGVAVAMPSESNSFKAARLREWAKDAGVDENDPLLLRALEAQAKADWRTNMTSWLDMEEAIYDFMEAHGGIKRGWPPNEDEIEMLLWKIECSKATATEIEEFRRLADETLGEWQPEHSPTFKERIEAALNLPR